jgi:hypothetical protein
MFVIQNLLVDKSFLALDRQLNAFNIFDVLNLREYEIRHTRFLAHLLDPCGTHGLGNAFLRNFLLQVSAQLASGERGGLLDEIHNLDLDLARVTAEISLATGQHEDETETEEPQQGKRKVATNSGRLDILLQIPRRGGRDIAIAIENKINAKESNGQLERYREWVCTRFDSALLLYLTVADEEVVPAWNNVTYSNVVYPALDLIAESSSTPGSAPALMMSHYMAVLRDKVEAEAAYADADSIAQELHRNYPAAKSVLESLRDRWQKPIDGTPLDSDWGLYNRYKAAFGFLLRYHTDELSTALRWFTTAWPQLAAATPNAPRIVVDDSNRSYMRFLAIPAGSALEELSQRYGQKARANGKFPWTSRHHATLFELRSYSAQQATRTDDQDSASETRWNLFLVVGPVQGIDRTALITRMRELLNHAFAGEVSGANGAIVPEVSQRKITQTYSSVLKWTLPCVNRAALESLLTSAQFLASLEQAARIVERALQEEPSGRDGDA